MEDHILSETERKRNALRGERKELVLKLHAFERNKFHKVMNFLTKKCKLTFLNVFRKKTLEDIQSAEQRVEELSKDLFTLSGGLGYQSKDQMRAYLEQFN